MAALYSLVVAGFIENRYLPKLCMLHIYWIHLSEFTDKCGQTPPLSLVVIELGHAVRQAYGPGFLVALPPVQGTS